MNRFKIIKKVKAMLDLQKEVDKLVELLNNPSIYKEPRNIIKILQTFYNLKKP